MRKYISIFIITVILCFTTTSYAFIDTSTAVQLAPNTEISGRIRYQNDRKIYSISVPENGSIQLCFKYPKSALPKSWRMIVLSGTYQPIYEMTDSTDTTDENDAIHITKKCRITKGRCYVLISGFHEYSTEKYNLTALYIPENPLYAESEITNNTPYFCPTVKLDSSRTGNLSNNKDVDYYCIKPTSPSFTVQVKSFVPSDINKWNVTILDQRLNPLLSSDNSETEIMKINNENYAYDSYFIVVSASENYTNDDYIISFMNE